MDRLEAIQHAVNCAAHNAFDGPGSVPRLESVLRENGYVIVPVEPTEGMVKAVAYGDYLTTSYGGEYNTFDYFSEDNARDVWRAMIAAEGK